MTDYAKLIERLRGEYFGVTAAPLRNEAADAIERLNVENAELATQHSTLLSWYDRLRAELAEATSVTIAFDGLEEERDELLRQLAARDEQLREAIHLLRDGTEKEIAAWLQDEVDAPKGGERCGA